MSKVEVGDLIVCTTHGCKLIGLAIAKMASRLGRKDVLKSLDRWKDETGNMFHHRIKRFYANARLNTLDEARRIGFRNVINRQKRDMYYAQVDRDVFNHSTSYSIDSFRTFLDLHYCLSSRNDSEYWRYVTENNYDNPMYKSFIVDLILRKEIGNNKIADIYENSSFGGEVFLVAGMNYSCYQKHIGYLGLNISYIFYLGLL